MLSDMRNACRRFASIDRAPTFGDSPGTNVQDLGPHAGAIVTAL